MLLSHQTEALSPLTIGLLGLYPVGLFSNLSICLLLLQHLQGDKKPAGDSTSSFAFCSVPLCSQCSSMCKVLGKHLRKYQISPRQFPWTEFSSNVWIWSASLTLFAPMFLGEKRENEAFLKWFMVKESQIDSCYSSGQRDVWETDRAKGSAWSEACYADSLFICTEQIADAFSFEHLFVCTCACVCVYTMTNRTCIFHELDKSKMRQGPFCFFGRKIRRHVARDSMGTYLCHLRTTLSNHSK